MPSSLQILISFFDCVNQCICAARPVARWKATARSSVVAGTVSLSVAKGDVLLEITVVPGEGDGTLLLLARDLTMERTLRSALVDSPQRHTAPVEASRAFAVCGGGRSAAARLRMDRVRARGPAVPVGGRQWWDVNAREMAAILPLVVFVFWVGFYPKPFLEIIRVSVEHLLVQTQVQGR